MAFFIYTAKLVKISGISKYIPVFLALYAGGATHTVAKAGEYRCDAACTIVRRALQYSRNNISIELAAPK